MTTEISEYTATEAALAELRGKYEAVLFDVTNGKGMAEAKAARAELRDYRVSLEKKRVEIKAPALERCRLIDTEAKRIAAELSALEDPIDATIKAEEHRKEREKAEREQREREAVEARNRRFDAIRATPLRAIDATVEQIEAMIAETDAADFSDLAAEYQDAAKYENGLAVLGLKAALDKRRLEDARAAKIAADLAELEELRAKRAAEQAEADRLAAAERERLAQEARRAEDQARAEREAVERAAREAREAEQARIDAERSEARAKEDAERAAAAEKLRKDQADAAAERRRLDKERADAAKAARAKEIADATLLTAASDAVAFLRANGHGENIVTLKLESAIRREPKRSKAA